MKTDKLYAGICDNPDESINNDCVFISSDRDDQFHLSIDDALELANSIIDVCRGCIERHNKMIEKNMAILAVVKMDMED